MSNSHRDIIGMFRSLPDAHAIPDCVATYQKEINDIRAIASQLEKRRRELAPLREKIIRTLLKDWTEEDLYHAGFLPF